MLERGEGRGREKKEKRREREEIGRKERKKGRKKTIWSMWLLWNDATSPRTGAFAQSHAEKRDNLAQSRTQTGQHQEKKDKMSESRQLPNREIM